MPAPLIRFFVSSARQQRRNANEEKEGPVALLLFSSASPASLHLTFFSPPSPSFRCRSHTSQRPNFWCFVCCRCFHLRASINRHQLAFGRHHRLSSTYLFIQPSEAAIGETKHSFIWSADRQSQSPAKDKMDGLGGFGESFLVLSLPVKKDGFTVSARFNLRDGRCLDEQK
jgi:hypothetical protein